MIKLILFLVCLVLSCAADPFEDECGLEGAYAAPLIKWGQEVKPYEFPWHVAIFALKGSRYDHFEVVCGGSLVRSDLVITAAHCFTAFLTNVADLRVVGGSHLSSWTSREVGKQTSEVLAVHFVEGGYDGYAQNFHADIAIIRLKNSFNLSDKVRTICLQLEDPNMDNWHMTPGLTGKVAGWGITEWGIRSETLKFLTVPVIGDEQCTNLAPVTYRRFLLPDKICAGLRNGSSVAVGDSGGGLVFRQNDRWYLRGVLSSASLTEPRLALYTNLQKYSSWLSKNLKELHQPAYTRPGAACTTNETIGVCREYSDCPTAISEYSLGFQLTRCPNSDPARMVICCATPVLTLSYISSDSNGQPVRVTDSITYRQKTINRSPNV